MSILKLNQANKMVLLASIAVFISQSCLASSLRVMLTTTKTDTECNKILAGFKAKYPSVEVIPVYSNLTNPALDPGRRPDVLLGWQDYVGEHSAKFEDLKTLVPPETLREFPKAFKEACSKGKYLLCLPCGGMADALAYNLDSFLDSGLAVPDASWTWSVNFHGACSKLTRDKNGDGTPEQWGAPGTRGLLDAIVYSYGGRFMDDTGKKTTYRHKSTLEGLNYFVRLLREKTVEPIDTRKQLRNLYEWPFYNGKSGMTLSLQGSLNPARTMSYLRLQGVNLRLGLCQIPRGPAGSISPVSLLYVVAITKSCQNKPDALKFVKYLSGVEGQSQFRASIGCLPATYSAVRSKDVTKSVASSFVKSFIAGIPDGLSSESFKARQTLWECIVESVKNNRSLEEAIQEAEKTML